MIHAYKENLSCMQVCDNVRGDSLQTLQRVNQLPLSFQHTNFAESCLLAIPWLLWMHIACTSGYGYHDCLDNGLAHSALDATPGDLSFHVRIGLAV